MSESPVVRGEKAYNSPQFRGYIKKKSDNRTIGQTIHSIMLKMKDGVVKKKTLVPMFRNEMICKI